MSWSDSRYTICENITSAEPKGQNEPIAFDIVSSIWAIAGRKILQMQNK